MILRTRALSTFSSRMFGSTRDRLRVALASVDLTEILAYALIALSPLVVYRVRLGVNLSLQRTILVLLLGVLCFQVLRGDRRLRRPTGPAAVALGAMLIFLFFELTQLPRSEQAGFARTFVGAFVAGIFVIGALLLAIDTPTRLRRAVIAFYASALVPLALGFYQLLGTTLGYAPTLPFAGFLSTDQLYLGNFNAEVGGLALARVPSTLGTPAFFGEFLVFLAVALIALFLVGEERRLRRLIPNAILIVLVLMSLIATLSRSAWILLVLGLVFVVFQARRHLRSALLGKRSRLVLPAMAIAFTLMLPLLSFSVGGVVSNALESFDLKQNDAGRSVRERFSGGAVLTLNPAESAVNSATASTETHLTLRQDALDLFRERPLLGVGLGNYGVKIGQEPDVSSAQTYGFTVLAEGGLVGFGLFFAMLATLLAAARSSYLSSKRSGFLPAALLGLYGITLLLVVNNLVLYDTLYADTSWVVMGLALAGANLIGPAKPSTDRGAPRGSRTTLRRRMTHLRKKGAGLSKRIVGVRRALGFGLLTLLIAGVISGCGLSGDEKSAPSRPRLLTVRDLEKYPGNSPEATLFKHFFFIQWGSARDLVGTLDPAVPKAVGLPALIDAYSFLRPGLAASKFRLVGNMDTAEGKLLTFEILPRKGQAQAASALLGKASNGYVILYDGLLDSGIPDSIRAAAAAQPATRQLRRSTERRVRAVMRRFHAAAGAPKGLKAASKRTAGSLHAPDGSQRNSVAEAPAR